MQFAMKNLFETCFLLVLGMRERRTTEKLLLRYPCLKIEAFQFIYVFLLCYLLFHYYYSLFSSVFFFQRGILNQVDLINWVDNVN